jgi:hypothetical protein
MLNSLRTLLHKSDSDASSDTHNPSGVKVTRFTNIYVYIIFGFRTSKAEIFDLCFYLSLRKNDHVFSGCLEYFQYACEALYDKSPTFTVMPLYKCYETSGHPKSLVYGVLIHCEVRWIVESKLLCWETREQGQKLPINCKITGPHLRPSLGFPNYPVHFKMYQYII